MSRELSYDFTGFEKFFSKLYETYKYLYFSRKRVAITKCLIFVRVFEFNFYAGVFLSLCFFDCVKV